MMDGSCPSLYARPLGAVYFDPSIYFVCESPECMLTHELLHCVEACTSVGSLFVLQVLHLYFRFNCLLVRCLATVD